MLKNILSLLLSRFYSKQESELVGHQAMPSASNTVITPSIKTECTTWSDAHIGIAPADGYLYVTGRTTNTDGFLQISSATTEIAATTFGNTDKDIRLLFPLAKGQAMKVTAKSLKNIFLRFSSSIGWGGVSAFKNALLQGGGLCLNSLSSSLRKSSCRVKKNGWLNNGMLIIQRKSSCLFQTLQGFRPILHQRMVCLSSRNLASERVISKLMRPVLGFTQTNTIQTLSFIRDLLFRLIRDRQSVIRHTRRTERACLALLSSPSLANRNSAVGGASC